jgi:protoheme IX farnesyltransferase
MPDYTGLFRLKLSLLNGVAAVSGYLLFPSAIQTPHIFALFAGVALLAAGGSAINQVLEADLDNKMTRTRGRPLPMQALTPASAAVAGSGVILAGTLLLISFGGVLPALLGVTALLWYLAAYTPLKRLTSLALPVGALCGAFPPLIGWSLAGGSISDYRVIILAGLMFLWQVPHFWLFQRRHEADYRLAGLPIFNSQEKKFGRTPFLLLWIVALTAAAMLLPAFGILKQPASFWYALFPVTLVFITLIRSEYQLFPYINCFPLLVTLLLLIQRRY